MSVAFVAGSTGYTGKEVVHQLATAGATVYAHVRPDSRELARWQEQFGGYGATVDTTPWDEGAMTRRLAELQPDQVYLLLGTTRARAKKGESGAVADTYEAVDYGLTALMIKACQGAGIQPRILYLSSMGVVPGTSNPYLNARHRIETLLKDGALPFTVARPSFITGPGRDEDRPGERRAAAIGDFFLKAASLLGAKSTADRYRSITNVELAAALIRLAQDPTAVGRIVEADGLR